LHCGAQLCALCATFGSVQVLQPPQSHTASSTPDMCFASAHLSANMDKISSLTTLILWHIDVYTHVTQLFPWKGWCEKWRARGQLRWCTLSGCWLIQNKANYLAIVVPLSNRQQLQLQIFKGKFDTSCFHSVYYDTRKSS